MRNPKQGQCASPPHVSKRRSCREERASICFSVRPMVAKPAAIMGSVRTNDPEYAGDLNCLGLRSAPRVDFLQEAAARNCSLNCPAETLSTFRSMTGREAMNSASSSGVISLLDTIDDFLHPRSAGLRDNRGVVPRFRRLGRPHDGRTVYAQAAGVEHGNLVGRTYPIALTFDGFDGNNDRHSGLASFLVQDMGRSEEFKGRPLNSHSQSSLPKYRNMVPANPPSTPDISCYSPANDS